MVKQSGNTYEAGFNDGVLCAWEEYSHLIDDFLDDVASKGIPLDYEIESFLSDLMSNVKEVHQNSDNSDDYTTEKFSDKAINRLEKI